MLISVIGMTPKLTNQKGFSLIEVIVAISILALSFSAALNVFSSNAQSVSYVENKIFASFVADNIMISSINSNEELKFSSGVSSQAGKDYSWKRSVNFLDKGRSVQIKITVFDLDGNELDSLDGYKVLK